jgi:hypothetical protein
MSPASCHSYLPDFDPGFRLNPGIVIIHDISVGFCDGLKTLNDNRGVLVTYFHPLFLSVSHCKLICTKTYSIITPL